MTVKNIFKICAIILLIVYALLGSITLDKTKVDAFLILIFAISFTIRTKENTNLLPISIFLLYCIYSISVGEFLTEGLVGVPMTEVKNLEVYGKTLRILLVFIGILSISYNKKNYKGLIIQCKNNPIIFYGIYFILIGIGFFGIDRTVRSSYSVSISPIYEYSIILFYFAYYYSGKLKKHYILLLILYIFFILQDFYYGGRITALQLVFMMMFTLLNVKMNSKTIIYSSFVGIFLNGLVAAYRSSYSVSGINLGQIFNNLLDNFFVFDTATYSFYASATHVATAQVVDNQLRFNSFLEFIKSVLIGSNNPIGNLTSFVSDNYYSNVGGGIFPTHIYFWSGWFGVVFFSILIAYFINNAQGSSTKKLNKYYLIFLATMPRWFLYNPLNLFRPLIFIFLIGQILVIADKITRKII